MAIYLEYEGIKGNVTAEGYKDHSRNQRRRLWHLPGNFDGTRQTEQPRSGSPHTERNQFNQNH